MPPFIDWLEASWSDFRRRWWRLMTVIGVGGAVTLLVAALPLIAALLAVMLGTIAAVPAIIAGSTVGVLAALWVSAWAQAAAMRAARFDETARQSLSVGWEQAPALAWVFTLVSVAVGGGVALFVLPGLLFLVGLFVAPFYQLSGEGEGFEALRLSWGRTMPRFPAVGLRLLALGVGSMLIGQIPYLGWLLSMLLSPFAIVATSRLADDLRAADPDPKKPDWMPAVVGGLFAALLVGLFASGLAVKSMYGILSRNLGGPDGVARILANVHFDQAAQDAMMAQATGEATPEQAARATQLYRDLTKEAFRVATSTEPAAAP